MAMLRGQRSKYETNNLTVQASISVRCHCHDVFQILDKAKFCILVLTFSLDNCI